jgi:uncharacterized protein YbjT (DUF2867 family)
VTNGGVLRVLVTGATGFVGRRDVSRLASERFPVVAVTRTSVRSLPTGVVGAVVPECNDPLKSYSGVTFFPGVTL